MIAELVLAALLTSAQAEIRRLPPVDECTGDASFVAFREDLLAAIERQDSAAILSIVSEDIEFSFRGFEGRQEFAERWGLDEPQESAFWDVLAGTLALGCMVDEDGARVSPAFFLQTGEDDDPFETFLVTLADAPLLAAPDTESETRAVMNWDVVTVIGDRDGWYEVRRSDGLTGFLDHSYARAIADYRVFFARIDGRWRMTVFVAGD